MLLNPIEAIILRCFFFACMKFNKLFPKGRNVIFSMDKKDRETENLKTLLSPFF